MRHLTTYLLIALTISIYGCKTESTELAEQTENINLGSIKGKFIRVSDNDRAGIEGVFKLIKDIEFKGNYCHFTYVTIKMSGKYEIDGNFIYIDTGSELGILSLEIINNNQLEGEGFIHGTFKREGTFKPEETKKSKEKTNSKIETKTHQAEDPLQTTTTNSSSQEYASSSNTTQASDPFGSGGNSSNSSGDSYGNNTGTGIAYGSGSGGGPRRVRLNEPNIENLNSDVDAEISLKLTINSDGDVVSAQNITSKTTTSNQILINKVIDAVKKQVKYNKEPGAPLSTTFMTISIKAR